MADTSNGQMIITWFFDNKDWVFSGCGVAAITIFGGWLFCKNKNSGQTAKAGDGAIVIQTEEHGEIYHTDGDISITHNHNGMSKEEFISLVNELVSTKMAQFTAEAKLEFEKRISSFTNEFYLRMLEQQTGHLLNRFSEPSIQASYRTAAIQYGLNEDKHKKDILIDLLLDRFSSQDISNDSIALDQAISNIGQVTNAQIDFFNILGQYSYFFTNI